MTITIEHLTLTDDQRKFKKMLSACPRLLSYWNFETHEVDIPALLKARSVMSSGENTLSLFYLGVWLNDETKSVSVIEIAALDDVSRKIVIDWLAAPYFP